MNSNPQSSVFEAVERTLRKHLPSLSDAQRKDVWHALQCEFGGTEIYVPRVDPLSACATESKGITPQDASLASFEARLAQEMINVSRAFNTLGAVAASVGEELPDAAYLDKLDLLCLSQMSSQGAQLFLKLIDLAPLLSHRGELIDKLRLQSQQLFTELHFDGKCFLAIVLSDESLDCTKSC